MLRCADDCGELVLEEWELQRLLRELPSALTAALRPSVDIVDAERAADIAVVIGRDPAGAFFNRCHDHGGFTARRA